MRILIQVGQVGLALCLSLTTGRAFAQNIIGQTTIDVDATSGIVTATCDTALDYAAQGITAQTSLAL